jgi:rubrerythrin
MKSPQDVYRRFIDFEEQAASIYLRMASRFSPENLDVGSVWLDMGIHEKQHAGLLQFCVAEELFAADLPSEREILETEGLFSRLTRQAANPDLSVEEAFEIAAQLETSEVNAIYDRLTTPLHASTYLLRRKIAASLPDHLEHLLHEARRLKIPPESLERLEQLFSRGRERQQRAGPA